MRIRLSRYFLAGTMLLALLQPVSVLLAGDDHKFEIKEAHWKSEDSLLEVKGVGGSGQTVTITSPENQVLGLTQIDEKEWKLKIFIASEVPCDVNGEQSDGSTDTSDVEEAPEDCSTESGGSDNEVSEHQDLVYNGPGTCLECHSNEAHDVFESVHYQWKGEAPYMVNQPYLQQGKGAGAVNTYCGNITGNWQGCSSCHIGRGAKPEQTSSPQQLENIDCLVCHQEAYKRKKVDGVMVPDVAKMSISIDEAVRTVHNPTRVNCLNCHAKAGGGDAVKRGDLALATANTTDAHYDVHMATTGANLVCQDCHTPENHRFPGKGSDLRPTDLDIPLDCASAGCHDAAPHDSGDLNDHTSRVACQTCHIPIFAKDAADSSASEATELDRSWQSGTHHTKPPYHPVLTKGNDLTPTYRHWNRNSDNYLLGDVIFPNPDTGTYQTSVPQGGVDDPDSKLYPFKYKTSDYPMHVVSNKLIALDTSVFFATADADAAALAGLENMGFDATDEVTWVTTDTYQLLNHQVSPEDDALSCNACHLNNERMNLQGALGFAPRDSDQATCASGCHDADKASGWIMGNMNDFNEYHSEHTSEGAACSECHGFSRN